MPKPKVEKPYGGGTYTKAAFFSFIRSALRQKSRRWAPIYQCLAKARRPSQSDNRRLRWEYRCKKCKLWYAQKLITVDHIKPVGTLREFDDLPKFVRNLFCEIDNLQVLCKECHDKKTIKDRKANAKDIDSQEISSGNS